MWSNDKELFQLMRTKLFPAVVGDILCTGQVKQDTFFSAICS
ncbi:hypothetical protein [Serratia liquefaciens]